MTKYNEQPSSSRIRWVDNAKAIGILLVMLGHTKGSLGDSVFIYSFHMPLFFFLSGYLLNRESPMGGFLPFAKRQYYKIVIPYLFFWIISYLYWLPAHSMTKKSALSLNLSFYAPFMGLLYGIGDYLYPNAVLWFLTCLFTTTLMFWLCYHFIGRRLLVPFAAVLALIVASALNVPKIRLPWNIDVSLVVLFFFSLGYFGREYEVINKLIHNKGVYNVISFSLCSFVLYFVVECNGWVSVGNMVFQNPILFFVAALLGILMVIYFSHILPRTKSFEWLSTNTVVLFSLHQLLFSIFTGVGVVIFGLPYEFNTRIIISFLYLVLAILLSIPSSFILKRYFPWAMGKRG